MRFFLLLLPFFLVFAEDSSPILLTWKDTLYEISTGSFPIENREKKKEESDVKISYIAYHPREKNENRPLTFVFNGGPGCSSCWLHLGMLGPKRLLLPEEGGCRSGPYQIIDNEESILDITDLVFVDPVGTGLESCVKLEDSRPYYNARGDVEAIGNFIRDYLTAKELWNRPIYLIGESYGTFRCAHLANYLQGNLGIYPKGINFISSVLDFQTITLEEGNLLPYLLTFPSYVATAWHYGKYKSELPLEDVLEEVFQFVEENYLLSLYQNKFPPELLEKIAEMTGLDLECVAKKRGKVAFVHFAEKFFASEQKKLSFYDTRYVRELPKFAYRLPYQDPFFADLEGAFSSGMHYFLANTLGLKKNYLSFSTEAFKNWNLLTDIGFEGGYPNATSALRSALYADPNLKLFFSSGYYDLVTPFAATDYTVQHLNVPESVEKNITKKCYKGGHMFYVNPEERKRFAEDLKELYR